jgi:hypothetical protein
MLGLVLALFLSSFIGLIVEYSCTAYGPELPRREGTGEVVDPLGPDKDKPGPLVLGLLESIFFYGALCVGATAGIAGWLGFKAASKWASWQHVMQLPTEITGLEELSYVRYRHSLANVRLTSFLVGTLGNLVAALAGASLRELLRVTP